MMLGGIMTYMFAVWIFVPMLAARTDIYMFVVWIDIYKVQ